MQEEILVKPPRPRGRRMQYKSQSKYCRRCGVLLTPGINWRPRYAKVGNYIGKECSNKYYLKPRPPKPKLEPYRIRHRDRALAQGRANYYRHRQNYLDNARRSYHIEKNRQKKLVHETIPQAKQREG